MIMQIWSLFLIIILKKHVVLSHSANYSVDDLKKRYPDYGTKWIYFPNGDGIPTVGYLEMPAEDTGIFPNPEDIKNAVSFRLYTRNVDTNGTLLTLDNKEILKAAYDTNKGTKFVTHGWLSSGGSDTCIQIKDGYLRKEDVNVIILDWSAIAGNIFYPIPMAHTKEIGNYYARFIDYLIENGANSTNMHLIGHSLGAHVSGFTGRAVTGGKIGRITALDPALPGFIHGFNVDHLLPSDADFVDVIHTCGGVLGILQNMGHADFYPNGGSPPQPGCFGVAEIVEACSHGRSWKYFAESIISELAFLAQKCRSWGNYATHNCEGESIPMGNPAPYTARGTYFLTTESSPPYVLAAKLNFVDDNEINK